MQHNSVNRYWHACRRKRQRPEARPFAVALLLAVLVSGCATAPPEPEPVPPDIDVAPLPEPIAEPEPECVWQKTKGVAEVVALGKGQAGFRFYPGDVAIAVPAGFQGESGQEFKAVLNRAPGCEPQLIVVEPVH